MSNATDPLRKRYLGYEVQEIVPVGVNTRRGADGDDTRRMLAEVGFNVKSRGNKIALFRSPETRDAIANLPPRQ